MGLLEYEELTLPRYVRSGCDVSEGPVFDRPPSRPKSPRTDCMQRGGYIQPPPRAQLLRPEAGLDVHRFEGRKQIPAGEEAVEVLPTIGIKCPGRGVVTYDGDIVHARKRREASERFFPKLSIGLVGLRPNGQGF